jgi:long-chain acyl-CoA synthetase
MELEPRANLDQICVMGSNLSQPVALGAIASKPGNSDLDNFETKLERIMNELNQRLEKSEKLQKWFLVEEVWSTDNDMITPTLKMRRQAIEKKYMPQIEQSLSSDKIIIWLKA